MRPVYRASVVPDTTTARVAKAFDYEFKGERVFEGWEKPAVPATFGIGLIVGPSGSGKSLLLAQFGQEKPVDWDNRKAIVSQFADSDEALARLGAVGLNSTPTWCSPYQVLSVGEKFRADLARKIESGAVIDEFTSVVDRNVAKTTCNAVWRYVRDNKLQNIVFASCHYDILEWLRPDWYFDTTDGILHNGRSLHRPKIKIELYPCKRTAWGVFSKHHYLSAKLASSADCYLALADFGGGAQVVGFTCCIPMPSGTLENAWRGHRTVVLPDFQGLGIGPRISDMLAQVYINRGQHYYSRTAHPRLIAYRNRPQSGWIRTVEDGKHRATSRIRANGKADLNGMGDSRICASHEFVGIKTYKDWWKI